MPRVATLTKPRALPRRLLKNLSKRAMMRRDEQSTRARLLEVAGKTFAEKGVDRATGKEICARANANPAAINYHFGSLENLYAAVLCEAHRRLATIESIQAAIA